MPLQNVFGALALDASVQAILTELQAVFPSNDSDMGNSAAIPNWAAGAVYQGTYKKVDQAGSLFAFVLSYVPFDTVNPPVVYWSEDGISPLMFAGAPVTTALNVSSIVAQGITYYVALTMINPPLIRGKYYQLYAKNGATMSSFFYALAGVGKFPATGSLMGLTDPLNQLSTAMLTRAVLAGLKLNGNFGNVALSQSGSLYVKQEGVVTTPGGALFGQGFTPHIRHDFGIQTGAAAVSTLQVTTVGAGSAVTADATNGGAVFATDAAAGSSVIALSQHKIPYSQFPGHGLQADITLFREPTSVALTGNAYVEWGLCDIGGPGNGFGYGHDAIGYYVFLRKLGTDVYRRYQAGNPVGTNPWNGDQCLGATLSLFRTGDVPAVLSMDMDNLYRLQSEFLYAAEQHFAVKTPQGPHVDVHVGEYPNSYTTTSLRQADLYTFVAVHNDTTSGGVLKFRSGSWVGGLFSSQTIISGLRPDGTYAEVPISGQAFVSTQRLLAGQTYQSPIMSRAGYVGINVAISTTVQSAYKGVVVHHYLDAAGTQLVQTDAFTYDAIAAGQGYLPFAVAPEGEYFDVFYTNGNVDQPAFLLDCRLETVATQQMKQTLAAALDPGALGVVNKSALMAQAPSQVTVAASGAPADSASTTSLTLGVPAGTLSGQQMTAVVFVSAQVTVTPPAGWSVAVAAVSGALQGGETMATFTRIASGSEPASYNFGISVASKCSGVIITSSGVSTVTPIFGGSGQVNGSQTAITAPAANVTPGSVVLGLFGITNTSVITPPTGFTQLTQDNNNTSLLVAAQAYPNFGSTGVVSATAGAARSNIGLLLVLAPSTNFQNARLDPNNNIGVADDYQGFQAVTQSLVANQSTQIQFSQPVRLVKIKNFDTANKILVKNSPILTPSDATADQVGVAPVINVPCTDYFPFKTQSIYVQSPGTGVVSVTGYF